jgi:transposase
VSKTFRPYEPSQSYLFPPSPHEWLPEGHLAYFVIDLVGSLELSRIMAFYERELRGFPPHHPRMLLGLLVYGYCVGVRSSRPIERKTHEDVAFRVISGGAHPDHTCVSEFRRVHLEEFVRLFGEILGLCREAGLVKLGHVAIDGTKVKANASKHKVPTGKDGKPTPKAQRNFTDGDSRIMKAGDGYVQAYNCQIAVDEEHQVIVGQLVTNQPPDCEHLPHVIEEVARNCGAVPVTATADSGYFSAENVAYARSQGVDVLIPTERWRHGEAPLPVRGPAPQGMTLKQEMTRRLRTRRARELYARRKVIVEPVFGQIKEARGIRTFLVRGLAKVRGEWSLIALTHNILKLWRAGGASGLGRCPAGGARA